MCTSIAFESLEGDVFMGRTQEYNIPYNYVAIQIPAKFVVKSNAVNWKTLYSVLGVGVKEDENEYNSYTVIDGVNEFGLSGASQYFSEFNIYASLDEIHAAGKQPIMPEQFVFWVLANCKTTYEIELKISQIAIAETSLSSELHALLQQFMFTDLSGRTLVVEPTKKLGFEVYKNPIGVMTNSPKFKWHLENLKNYAQLSDNNVSDTVFEGLKISSAGKGSGLLGMPGDYTSASRFIRASFLLKFSDKVSSQESINKAFHILSTSDIVKGCIKLSLPGNINRQYTQYISVYDLKNKVLFVKTYGNFTIQKIKFTGKQENVLKVYEIKKP